MATLDEQALRAKYEASLQEAQKATEVTPHEDFSDLVAEHAGKQAKKRKQMADGKDKAAKKLRDFKF
ncbi:hypothetical protein IWQ60_011591 [Tieghemiomyces parasiticus]|nr:hypothetical protein IWQ60_011591 [Tieghemiomyces parasiticus]